MEHSPSSGPRLWNALAQVDQDYGMPSFEYTRLWNALQRVVKIMECLPQVDQDYEMPSLDLPSEERPHIQTTTSELSFRS